MATRVGRVRPRVLTERVEVQRASLDFEPARALRWAPVQIAVAVRQLLQAPQYQGMCASSGDTHEESTASDATGLRSAPVRSTSERQRCSRTASVFGQRVQEIGQNFAAQQSAFGCQHTQHEHSHETPRAGVSEDIPLANAPRQMMRGRAQPRTGDIGLAYQDRRWVTCQTKICRVFPFVA